MTFPHFIAHDVLQVTRFKPHQRNAIKTCGTFTQLFMEAMKGFEGYPVTLACLSEGVGQTDLVEYIKAHPEWTVQCHGTRHQRYDALSEEQLDKDLKKARAILEQTFCTHITEFYPPFNRYNERTQAMADKNGMIEKRAYRKPGHYKKVWHRCQQMDFHFWYAPDVSKAMFVKGLFSIEPSYIIGAPRSGTTALMRHWAIQRPELLVLKEVEKIWRAPDKIRLYYDKKLRVAGKCQLVDKNARNSLRILQIQKMFPNANFTHIIRDGRAVANSWRNWAVKTNKVDQTIEGAVGQWVEYVSYIRKHQSELKRYSEVRYEELCHTEDYFTSRNNKWKKSLTVADLDIINRIGGPLLKELGYQ